MGRSQRAVELYSLAGGLLRSAEAGSAWQRCSGQVSTSCRASATITCQQTFSTLQPLTSRITFQPASTAGLSVGQLARLFQGTTHGSRSQLCQAGGTRWRPACTIAPSIRSWCSATSSTARTVAHQRPTGWQAWLPREWALRPAFSVRVAIINAVYTAGGHVHRMLPLLLAEALRRDSRWAGCFAGPAYEYVVAADDAEEQMRKRTGLRAVAWQVKEALSDLLRFIWLALLFGPVAITAPLAFKCGVAREAWMQGFRRTLETAGPAFIKWGQWAATRHDLFPPDMCSALEAMQTRAPAHSLDYTQKAIQRAFGVSVSQLFSKFEEQPTASGSIGQVYKAVLSSKGARNTGMEPGTVVAVKVRHPGVGKSIQRDFALMIRIAQVAGLVPAIRKLHLEDSLRQFAAPLREQVDLALEARHLWQFNYNFRHNKNVRFPFPIYPLVAPEVLVETFEEGESISRYVALGPTGSFNSRLAALGSKTMLQMMLVDNLIHSDLHPGNILVALDPPPGPLLSSLAHLLKGLAPYGVQVPKKWLQPRIVLLDVGMATHLSREDQTNMYNLFRAFAFMDGAAVARWTLAFAGQEQTCPDPPAFQAALAKYFEAFEEGCKIPSSEYSNGAEAMSAVLELVREHEVVLPGHICAVVVTTLVLEGWSSKLDPAHSILGQVETLVAADAASWGERIAAAVDEIMTGDQHIMPI
ncbi:hypothetical protein WJX72_006758 [[Myrmecia] bisecta]|uniref:ABC1 atypical kinase-like domain-containing protein n=1 Tax=[Myrmecia] bisecta TaxID=41462 RepID=A0AAW1PGK6_9CHLO